jgi:hypothetical protein
MCSWKGHAVAALLALSATGLKAHGGGLNAEGCHFNRKTGDYHCHRSSVAVNPQVEPPSHSLTPTDRRAATPQRVAPSPASPTCYVGPRGGTYTLTPSGRKNYAGC